MSDVILVCGRCGDRRSLAEASLGEVCLSCHIDGYRSWYLTYFGKAIDAGSAQRVRSDQTLRSRGDSVQKFTETVDG